MRIPGLILLLICLLPAAAPPLFADARQPERARFSGLQYVRLPHWAQANQFSSQWLIRNKSLLLTNRHARLVFTLDPREDCRKAEINGTAVLLANPIIYRGGKAYISQLDIEDTIEPVLSPPRNPPGIKVKTVCLDPGHGGNDPGFTSGSHHEKQYTLLLAQQLRDDLTRAGFNVVMTRTADSTVSLDNRTVIPRKRGADLFVSLHFNSAGANASEVNGIEVYCMTPAGAYSSNAGGEGNTQSRTGNQNDAKNMLLAYEVQRALARSVSSADRGVHRARFQVLRDATMPAILIEGGYMSNAAEARKIFDPAHRRKLSRAIVDGILAYKKNVRG